MLKPIYATGLAVTTAITGVLALDSDDYKKFIPVAIAAIVLFGLAYIYAEWRERSKTKDEDDTRHIFERTKRVADAADRMQDQFKKKP